VNSDRLTNWILPASITLLALADGVLHFMLDVLLFRGNFFGRLGPPPGAPPPTAPGGPPPGPPVPLPLPLNQMFVLNLVGYVLLVALLWFALRSRPAWRRWVDGLLIVYVVVVFLSWVNLGMPNPMGLGYLSKGIEVVLVVALAAHVWLLSRTTPEASPGRASDAILAR
jgi:hypothetical protein